MDNDAEVARELDRLRGELLEFVVDALGERMANGEYAELSERLVEAIDRRVDQAVAARLADTDWPDPDRFVDEVLASAAGRAGEGDTVRTTRRPAAAARKSGLSTVQLAVLMVGAVLLTALATYFVLQSWSGGTTTTTNVAAPIAPDPVVYDANGVQIQPANTANPAPPATGNAAQNVAGPTP